MKERILELIDQLPCKISKVSVLLDFIEELGGTIHQQSNVIGNTSVGAISGSEIRASQCAVETRELLEALKEKVIEVALS